MTPEGLTYDRKALAAVARNRSDWDELAKDAVAFAAARGGTIDLGISDGAEEPPAEQRIEPGLPDLVCKRLGEKTVNVTIHAVVLTRPNGGQVLRLQVPRSTGMPSTSDGRFFLRIGDTSKPITGNDVQRLIAERGTMPWEVAASPVPRTQRNAEAWARLVVRLRSSDRVKASVKEKADDELLDHYHLADAEHLTNLGVLCVGWPLDRARLGTAPIIQAITYDELGAKISKLVWDDHALSPIELIDVVWSQVPAFRESYELRHGLLAQQVPAFDEAVIREVLVNALVHRPYTQRGDIFLNLYPDRLEVVNPGPLPAGVTPANILHATVRRNDEMARLFHDVGLMEREGSGYDLLYARLLATGRSLPVVREGPDRVEVTIPRRVLKPAMVELMAKAADQLQLSRRETIVLGLLALHDGRTAIDLANDLEVEDAAGLAAWLGRLQKFGVVATSGRTKGVRYFIAPEVLRRLDFLAPTTLTRIQPHRLDALVQEDLRRYPGATRGEIHARIGSEIPLPQLKRCLKRLRDHDEITASGLGKATRYRIGAAPAKIPAPPGGDRAEPL